METSQNYLQQQVTGSNQIVILDSSLTGETDALETFTAFDPPIDPEEEEIEEDSFKKHIDEDLPTGEEQVKEEEDEPGLNHSENDDLSLNIEDDSDDLY